MPREVRRVPPAYRFAHADLPTLNSSPRISPSALGRGLVEEQERGADRGGGRPHGGKTLAHRVHAVESTARWSPASSRQTAGITSPAGRPVERTGARGRTQGPRGHQPPRRLPGAERRHPLRGRPAVHPDGCSSSRFRSSSMPSRIKDEAFLYLVYGTISLIKSHVA
jgi:hypothetical protein